MQTEAFLLSSYFGPHKVFACNVTHESTILKNLYINSTVFFVVLFYFHT